VDPITVENIVRMIDVLTERPNMGPNMPIWIRTGLQSRENQNSIICSTVRHSFQDNSPRTHPASLKRFIGEFLDTRRMWDNLH
jgi:hypothetical protein